MEAIQAEFISFLAVVLTACVGLVTKQIVAFLNEKGLASQIEKNKKLVKIVVEAVEQSYKELDGEQKLQLVKSKLVKLMNEKKISISQEELDLMIEAMVKEMNDSIKDNINIDIESWNKE